MLYFYFIFFVMFLFYFLMKIVSNNFFIKKEKIYSFECGFDSFFFLKMPFSLQFFKILLIFLLFDIEIVLILPIIFFKMMNFYFFMISFIIIMLLVLGLYFEWKEGSLNWMK